MIKIFIFILKILIYFLKIWNSISKIPYFNFKI